MAITFFSLNQFQLISFLLNLEAKEDLANPSLVLLRLSSCGLRGFDPTVGSVAKRSKTFVVELPNVRMVSKHRLLIYADSCFDKFVKLYP